MDASALSGIPFDGFETFPEYLRSLDGRLGVNAAFYVGHCAVRRYVMGDACQSARPPTTRSTQMAAIVADAMRAGAAGFSSTHSPTALRLGRPSRPEPVVVGARARTARRSRGPRRPRRLDRVPAARRRSVASPPRTKQLLIRLSLSSRLPVVIQGLGARSKVDAPTAGWDNAKRFVDAGHRPGRGRLLPRDVEAVQPHVRPRHRYDACTRGALEFHRMFTDAPTVQRMAPVAARPELPGRHPSTRSSTRTAIRRRDRRCRRRTGTSCTSTRSRRAENEKYVGRTLTDMAGRARRASDRRCSTSRSRRISRASSCGGPRRRVDRRHP